MNDSDLIYLARQAFPATRPTFEELAGALALHGVNLQPAGENTMDGIGLIGHRAICCSHNLDWSIVDLIDLARETKEFTPVDSAFIDKAGFVTCPACGHEFLTL